MIELHSDSWQPAQLTMAFGHSTTGFPTMREMIIHKQGGS